MLPYRFEPEAEVWNSTREEPMRSSSVGPRAPRPEEPSSADECQAIRYWRSRLRHPVSKFLLSVRGGSSPGGVGQNHAQEERVAQ